MSPSPYFSQADSELISILDPEPTIITFVSDLVPPFPKIILTRTISWHNAEDFVVHRLYEDYPFAKYGKVVTQKHLFYSLVRDFETRNGVFGQKPMKSVSAIIIKTNWYLKLWRQYNPNVPDYAFKHITSLININLSDGKLIVCYHTVARGCWYPIDCNPTEVIPRTQENLRNVIDFHAKSAIADWFALCGSKQYRPL